MIYIIVSLVLGFILGLILGYFIGKSKTEKVQDFTNLSMQISEIRTKFEEIERLREKLEREREERLKEFMENTQRFFKEMSDKNVRLDEEKDKRIRELVEQMQKFFEEQKQNTERFLMEQGKSREEIEKRRDAQIADMKKIIEQFMRTVSGTKTRGILGENILKEVLKESIKVGLVKMNLKLNGKEVEFAWDLGDGKYIPIDAKMPDIMKLIETYEKENNESKRNEYKKEIIKRVNKRIDEVKKYQNLSKTINEAILVVPEVILEIAPELIEMGKKDNVYITTYKTVIFVAHLIQDKYMRTKEEGEIGEYKQIIESLLKILDNIQKKVDTMERALKTISNAKEEIKNEIIKGKGMRI